jgi:membrane protease YdiL (CAAX protease family)
MAADPVTMIPFALLLAAVLGLWIHRAVWMVALVAAVATAYYTGALYGLAAVWLALLAAFAWAYRMWRDKPRNVTSRAAQLIAGTVFFLLALALGLVLLPGFPRTVLIAETVLSPGAAPFALGLGFPKVAAGILILGLINETRVRSWRELGEVLRRAVPILLVTALVVMVFTLAAGYVRVDPKWTPLFFTWAAANLFFTCLAEEAFFRGFVQAELARLGGRGWTIVAIATSAVLFGLAHFGGGSMYVIAATLAGLGYALAYHRTQRIEAAMAVHFGLNAVHFLLFTYPRLA